MFQKFFLTLITAGNLIALFAIQYFTKLEPFYILAATYFISSILVIGYYRFLRTSSDDFNKLVDTLLNSGKGVIFLAFLSVIDIIIFMLLVPSESVNLLQTEAQTNFVFYGMLIFFVPIIFAKFSIEPKGKQIEEFFWFQFTQACNVKPPSSELSLFVLTKVQLKFMPLSARQTAMNPPEQEPMTNISDQIVTTTFPLDYNPQKTTGTVETQDQNSLFDEGDQPEEENVFDKYYQELYEMVPQVRDIVEAKPVSMRPELFLNVIIEKTTKDEKMIQYFKERSAIDMNTGN